MAGLLRLILLVVFVYLVFKLIRLVLTNFILAKQAHRTQDQNHSAGQPRVDKSKAQDAEFEEIKNK